MCGQETIASLGVGDKQIWAQNFAEAKVSGPIDRPNPKNVQPTGISTLCDYQHEARFQLNLFWREV